MIKLQIHYFRHPAHEVHSEVPYDPYNVRERNKSQTLAADFMSHFHVLRFTDGLLDGNDVAIIFENCRRLKYDDKDFSCARKLFVGGFSGSYCDCTPRFSPNIKSGAANDTLTEQTGQICKPCPLETILWFKSGSTYGEPCAVKHEEMRKTLHGTLAGLLYPEAPLEVSQNIKKDLEAIAEKHVQSGYFEQMDYLDYVTGVHPPAWLLYRAHSSLILFLKRISRIIDPTWNGGTLYLPHWRGANTGSQDQVFSAHVCASSHTRTYALELNSRPSLTIRFQYDDAALVPKENGVHCSLYQAKTPSLACYFAITSLVCPCHNERKSEALKKFQCRDFYDY